MATTAILIALLLLVLATDLRRAIFSGNRKLACFYSISFAISSAVIVLSSVDVNIYGPSQLIMDIAKALHLIDL